MWTLGRTAACTVVIAFLAPEFGFAQCESSDSPKCTHVTFRDPLGISKCLNKTWDICTDRDGRKQEESIKKLASCLTQSEALAKLTFMFLDGVRGAMLFLFDLVFPGASHSLTWSNRMAHQRRTQVPDGCKKTVNVSVPENPGIRRCTALVQTFCTGLRRHDRHVFLATLLSSLVCILQNIPPTAALKLLKEFACRLLVKVIHFLNHTRAAPMLLPVLQLLQVVFNCDVYKPKAE